MDKMDTLKQQAIKEMAKRELAKRQQSLTPATAQAPQTLTGSDNPVGSLPGIKQATQIGVGIGSGFGQAMLNIPKAGLKLAQGVSNIGNKILGTPKVDYSKAIQGIDTLSTNLFQKPVQTELNTTGGKIGKIVGQTAPYFMGGGGAISELSNAASKAVSGGGAIARIATGTGTEALANLVGGYALSGGDTKEAKNQALVAGAFKAGFSTIGEIANAIKLPESMVGKIFKTNKEEVQKMFKTGTDDTLAKEVLDRGISGNTKQIAHQLTTGMSDAETKLAQEFEKAGNPTIKLSNPDTVISYLKDKANMMRKAGATEIADGLDSSIPAINPQTGEVTANNALGLRRFLDGLRSEKSYVVPTEELKAQQAGLTQMTEEIRSKINSIGGTKGIMKDYQFFIKAMDKLTKHAVSSRNNDALGIINTFLLGEGIAQLNPAFMGVVGARKFIGSTIGATKGAQVLKELPKSGAIGSTTRAITGQAIGQMSSGATN